MDVSAPAISLADRRRWAIGPPESAGAGNTEPPSRLTLSQTSAGSLGAERSGQRADFEVAAVSQDTPGDTGEPVGESYRQLTNTAIELGRQAIIDTVRGQGPEPPCFSDSNLFGRHNSAGPAG